MRAYAPSHDIKNENKGRINIARSRPKTHECRWETSELKIIRNSFAFLIIIEAKVGVCGTVSSSWCPWAGRFDLQIHSGAALLLYFGYAELGRSLATL